jgi:hypothetical protein
MRPADPESVRLLYISHSTLDGGGGMLVRHHHDGRVFEIEFPEGSRVYRCKTMEFSVIWVPDAAGGDDHPVPDRPAELMVQLAGSGTHGLRVISERPSPASHP